MHTAQSKPILTEYVNDENRKEECPNVLQYAVVTHRRIIRANGS